LTTYQDEDLDFNLLSSTGFFHALDRKPLPKHEVDFAEIEDGTLIEMIESE